MEPIYFDDNIKEYRRKNYDQNQINREILSFSSAKGRSVCLIQAVAASKFAFLAFYNNILNTLGCGFAVGAFNLIHVCTLGYFNANNTGFNSKNTSQVFMIYFSCNINAIFLNTVSFIGFELRAIAATIIHPVILLG
jgi:hypothetical protein